MFYFSSESFTQKDQRQKFAPEGGIIFTSTERKCRTEPLFSVNRINVLPTENRIHSWSQSLDLRIPIINWQKQSAIAADSIIKLFCLLFYAVHSPALDRKNPADK